MKVRGRFAIIKQPWPALHASGGSEKALACEGHSTTLSSLKVIEGVHV